MRLNVLRLAIFLGFLGSVASAQTSVATGVYPLGTFNNQGFDTINVGNLNTHFVIPVINKPGRGLPLYYNLNYDSAVWTPVSVGGGTAWSLASAAGWRGDTEIATGFVSFNSNTSHGRLYIGGPICYITTYANFVYHDPFGVAHGFPIITVNDGCYGGTVTSGSATATDNSGFTMNVSSYDQVQMVGKDGHTFTPPTNSATAAGSVIDSNGNEVSADGSGHFTDTLGMTAVTVAGSTSSAETFTYKDTSGSNQTVTVNYSTYTVQTNFGCSGISEYGPASTQLVSSVVMPDGSTYSFGYEATPSYSGNVTGRLASIQLPAGGTISYAYSGSNNGINCADGGTMILTRSLPNDGIGTTTWTYTRTPGSGTSHTSITDGLTNDLEYDFVYGSGSNNLYETHRQAYNGPVLGSPVLDLVTCYNGTTPVSSCPSATLTPPITETDTYATYDGLVQNGTTTTYDSYGDLLNRTVYDYGTSSSRGSVLTSETLSGYGSATIISEPTLDEVNDASGNLLSYVSYGYDATTPTATSGLPQHTVTGYPGGNLTSVTVAAGTTTYTYDDAGQKLSTTDPNGNTTSYSYDSSYDAYLTGISYPTVGSATQTSSATYDFNTGLPLTNTVNGNTTTYTYNAMLQPLTATYPDGGETSWTYSPSGTVSSTAAYTTTTTLHTSGSSYTTTTTLDWYARPKEVASPAASGTSLVDYGYDANGNPSKTSNPYASGGSPLWNTFEYDVLGRARTLVEPDCSGSSCSTQYAQPYGNSTLLTDEAGNQRYIYADGLGRVSKVLELNSSGTAFSLETDYLYYQNYSSSTYQTLVQQKGGSSSSSDWRQRTFTYDIMGRLLTENTPEAGTTTYTYVTSGSALCSGNLNAPCTRTDARGAKATYSYDADNRLTGITYTTSGTTAASTPSVSYYYDQTSYNGLSISNGLGNRTGMSDGTGSTAWSFDSMGRTLATRKTLNSHTLQANYTYNLDGTINTLQDFSGDTLTYAYNSAGQPTGVSDSSNSYASSATYNAAGQLTSLNHQLTSSSAVLQRQISYSAARLQPTSIQAYAGSSLIQSLTLNYPTAPANNGNISSITNNMDTSRSQSFSYDNLNRLTAAGDASHWGESYTYDNWGNMLGKSITAGSGIGFSISSAPNNQNTTSLSYDSAGDVTADEFGNSFSYDANGRIVTGGTGTYAYDGDGSRVEKTVGSTTTLYWPVSLGAVVDESDSTASNFGKQVFFAGLRVWSQDIAGNSRFLFTDHLGSTRVTANSSGSVLDDIDYRGFGDVFHNYGGSPTSNHYLYTGYESDDSENNTDFAQFRNHSPYMGRFSRPDPYNGSYDPNNPQTLNRYTYGLNSPLKFIDPSGLQVLCYKTTIEIDTWVPPPHGDGQGHWDINTTSSISCTSDGPPPSSGGGGGSGGGASTQVPNPNKPHQGWRDRSILPPCSAVTAGINTVGHVGSAITIGAAIYTGWTGVTIPYLTQAGVSFAALDLIGWGLSQIPGCQ